MAKKGFNSKRKQLVVRTFSEVSRGTAPERIQVLPVGEWDHPGYGPMVITDSDLHEFKENFDKGLRLKIPITEGHESPFGDEKPAVAWFTEVDVEEGVGLFADVEWTEDGKDLVESGKYKYFSPEFHFEYDDPETREIHKNVLVGGALTNKPYFKSMNERNPVMFSEGKDGVRQNIIIKLDEENDMLTLEAILAKAKDELTAEEIAYLKEHREELTDDQKAEYADVLETEDGTPSSETTTDDEAGDGEGEGEGSEEDGTETGDEGEGDEGASEEGEEVTEGEGGDNPEGGVNASEKGMTKISASELARLQARDLDLRKRELSEKVSPLVFSNVNRSGVFLPKSKEALMKFAESLSGSQLKAFTELMKSVPSVKNAFSETGSDTAMFDETTATGKVEKLVASYMKDDENLSVAEATKRAFRENPGLEAKYLEETDPNAANS